MIYFEAFANALDAGATEFNVSITLPEASDWLNMTLELTDNGEGFNDERFGKFKKLLDVEERTHKGLGRLVYLCYFDKVRVESVFEPGKVRKFEFNEDFDGKNDIAATSQQETGTKFFFVGFNNEKIGKTDYLRPAYIKKALLENFYMKFYKAKLADKHIVVNITLKLVALQPQRLLIVQRFRYSTRKRSPSNWTCSTVLRSITTSTSLKTRPNDKL